MIVSYSKYKMLHYLPDAIDVSYAHRWQSKEYLCTLIENAFSILIYWTEQDAELAFELKCKEKHLKWTKIKINSNSMKPFECWQKLV